VNIWLIIALAGAGTFAIRLSMLVFVHHTALPALARDALRFVMPAVLAAVILPAVLYAGDGDDLSLRLVGNERILAAALSAAVAWATRNVWLTIGVGMAALWLLKAMT
jgi:branched-subunit amino acid transport protein